MLTFPSPLIPLTITCWVWWLLLDKMSPNLPLIMESHSATPESLWCNRNVRICLWQPSAAVLCCRSVPAAVVWQPISPSPGFLDFPTVNVNVDPDSNIMFYFKHPWLLYGSSLLRLKFRKKKSNEEKMTTRIPDFSYSVKVNQVRALSGPQGTFVGSMTWFKIKKLSLKRDMRSSVIAGRTQDTTRLLAVALVWSGSSQLCLNRLLFFSAPGGGVWLWHQRVSREAAGGSWAGPTLPAGRGWDAHDVCSRVAGVLHNNKATWDKQLSTFFQDVFW